MEILLLPGTSNFKSSSVSDLICVNSAVAITGTTLSLVWLSCLPNPKLLSLLYLLFVIPSVVPVFFSTCDSNISYVPRSACLSGSSMKSISTVATIPIPDTTSMLSRHPTASFMKDVRLAKPTPTLIAAT